MQCPRCQSENPSESNFCLACGSRLTPIDGPLTDVSRGHSFCNKCGAPTRGEVAAQPRFASPEAYTPKHLAEKILTSKASLEGERKQVTVLFADMEGSMELLAARDPEEARRLLDPVLERMMEAVHRYEGTVNQVMGDGIMALFGAPLAHEDHADRACYAALRMQELIRLYSDEVRRTVGTPISIRVGLNSGEVVVRSIRNDLHMDYSAIGQTTHLASRMEQAALPGSILLTADTLRLVEGYVKVEPLGPIAIKGLKEPVETYEVTEAGPARSRLQATAARGLTRFIGREAEAGRLLGSLEKVAAGHGQVVAVVGESGVGKSRLSREIAHSRRVQDWLILEAGAVSYGKTTPYLPVVDMLKVYFQINAQDDAREIREKVTGKLLTLERSFEPAIPVFVALLDVPVQDPRWEAMDPPQRRHETLEAIRRLLVRESLVRPLLLVFEDLQWIDSETQALLDSLVETLAGARILLLVNYRPEYEHGWGSKTYYTQIRIDPLPPESSAELLRALLGAEVALGPLKELLIERTEGNPFFIEEGVRMLLETKVLIGEPGAYHLAKPTQSIQVPATVQAMLTARIDRLPAREKKILQCAAVVGKDVPFQLLRAIAEEDEESLHRGLDYLRAAEFLYETSLFPEPEYTFKHALTHEVAYGSLLAKHRRALHGQLVDTIEGLYGDRVVEQVERLAHHASHGEIWSKAVAYLRQAGTKAAARSAHPEAVAYLEQALTALRNFPESASILAETIDLYFDLRNSLYPLAEFERIRDHLREAENLSEMLKDRRRLSRALLYRSQHDWWMGDPRRALGAARDALAIASDVRDSDLEIMANYFLGVYHHTFGDYRSAVAVLQQGIELITGDLVYHRFGGPGLLSVFFRSWLTQCHVEHGDFAEATTVGYAGLKIAEVAGSPYSIAQVCFSIGLLHLRQGVYEDAIEFLERGTQVCRSREIHILLPRLASALGYVYTLTGRSREGLALLEEAIERATGMKTRARHILPLAWLSQAYLAADRLDRAAEVALDALSLAREQHEHGHEAWVLVTLANVAAAGAPTLRETEEDYYRQALVLARERGMRPLMAHCHLGLGTRYRRTENGPRAEADLATAAALFREMKMRSWLDETESLLGLP
jgi:class 3 adenylate cyclase/tetratricopeptide (TPR) repeat protein